MAELDDDRLELLERQLSEKVSDRVRSSLFKVYATVGAAVIFVIGFVSWDIVDDIKQELKDEFVKDIEEDIDTKRSRIDELVIESGLLANRVNGTIVAVDEQLTAFQPKVDKLNKMFERVESLTVDAQNSIDIYNNEVLPLVSNVNALSEQLRVLAEQVDAINALAVVPETGGAADAVPEPVYQQRAAAIQSVIEKSDEVQNTIQSARRRNTVFLQYSGSTRADTKELAAMLESNGFYVPGEEFAESAYGKREVRFFHPEDEDAAKELAESATRAIQAQGYKDLTIDVKDFTEFTGKKPRAGVLELWVGFPRTNAEASRF